jgi:hypothetical protein
MLARAFLGADQAPSARLWPRQIQCVPPRKRSADDADLLVRRLGCALGINHRSRISAEQGCCFGGSLLTAYIALAGIFTSILDGTLNLGRIIRVGIQNPAPVDGSYLSGIDADHRPQGSVLIEVLGECRPCCSDVFQRLGYIVKPTRFV